MKPRSAGHLHVSHHMMPDAYLIKLVSLLLGVVGTSLGVYNLWDARSKQKHELRKAYAITLLWLEPLIQKLISLPLASPNEFLTVDRTTLAIQLEEVEVLLDDSKERLVTLIPDIASNVLTLQQQSISFRKKLMEPSVPQEDCFEEARNYLEAAFALSMYRGISSQAGFNLPGHQKPTIDNYHGDTEVKKLVDRWESFAKHNLRRLTHHSSGPRA